MKSELVSFTLAAKWHRLLAANGEPYTWGMRKSKKTDPNWDRSNIIYRWMRSSDDVVAVVGESRRTLSARINNYISGKGDGKAGLTNKRVCAERQRLILEDSDLYLECLVELDGFNFTSKIDRRSAEGLLTAFYRPYCRNEEEF